MTNKKLTVGELKAEIPLLDSYEFKKYNFYLFIVSPESQMNPASLPKLKAMLNEAKIRHCFVMDTEEGLKIFELKAGEE